MGEAYRGGTASTAPPLKSSLLILYSPDKGRERTSFLISLSSLPF